MLITQEQLKELLSYDPETGVFVWLVSTSNRVKAGDVAGTFKADSGYIFISALGHIYRAHRLAWLYMTGEWPPNQIDHINCVRDDNRWSNLREATNAQNQANKGPRCDNSTGFKGVRFDQDRQKFRARVKLNGKEYHLGRFGTAEEAHAAYVAASIELLGEFARAS